LISKFDLSKALLQGLEVPEMASTFTRRAPNEIKRIVEECACRLTAGYRIPTKPRCRVFSEDYLEFLPGMQFNFAPIGVFVELNH